MFLFSNYEQLIGLRYDTKFYGFVPDLSLNNPSKSIFIHCIFCNCFATGPLENWKIFNRNSNGMDFSLKISFLSSFPLLYCSCVAISWLLTNPGTVFIPNGTLPTFFNTRRMICFGNDKIVRQEAAATNTEGREWFSFICKKMNPDRSRRYDGRNMNGTDLADGAVWRRVLWGIDNPAMYRCRGYTVAEMLPRPEPRNTDCGGGSLQETRRTARLPGIKKTGKKLFINFFCIPLQCIIFYI